VFSKAEFKDLLSSYYLVQLYTDVVPDAFYAPAVRGQFGSSVARQKADASVNRWFQLKAFGSEQLPLYVILEPLANGKVEVVGTYDEGKINDEAAFAEFLRKPLDATGGPRAQASAR
jgi:thiol:disulfide interchange protein DsbD